MLGYTFSPLAARDFEAVARWYGRISPALGRKAVDAIIQAINVARDRPLSCPEVEDGVRGIVCARFSYRVYFRVMPDRIKVLAIYHASRDPERWNDPDRE